MKKTIGLLLIGTSTLAAALPWDAKGVHTAIQNQQSQASTSTRQRVTSILTWFNKANTDHKLLNKQTMQLYFAKHVRYSVNGTTAAKSRHALYQRFQAMLHTIKHYHVALPPAALVANKNTAVLVYRLNTQLANGAHYHDLIGVTMHFNQQGKITRWNATIDHQANAHS